jgi:glycosyltransferase involved in cell wall biosynthesis
VCTEDYPVYGSRIAVISSRVGANSRLILHREMGFLVDSRQEWIEAVEHLESDPSVLDKMGSAGYQRMQENYSQQAVVESIVENLKARQLIPDAHLA